jgi:glutamate-1-semialdehyde 2,1-aminomutase
LFFGVERVGNFSEACAADVNAYARFFHGMLERGFYLPPSQFEAAFLSLAHSDADVDGVAEAAAEVLAPCALRQSAVAATSGFASVSSPRLPMNF